MTVEERLRAELTAAQAVIDAQRRALALARSATIDADGCVCPDCLAHRDPSEYGDRAKMVAAIDALREALEAVLSETENDANVVSSADDAGYKVTWFELSSSTESIARAALEVTRPWTK